MAMHKLPRDLVLILRTEAKNQRTPPIDYVIAEDGGRMVHRPEPDIAMAELLEEAATALTTERAAHAYTKWTEKESFQKYVDANEARIEAEAQRDEALKALRGLLGCPDIADNDYKDEETHVAERAARHALKGARMVDTPEKVWLKLTPYSIDSGYAVKPPDNYVAGHVEYVRADVAEALTSAGAVKVKPLDEDDYEEITNAAGIAMRRASRGIRGQVITIQDSFDWWVMKETERRILSALDTHQRDTNTVEDHGMANVRDKPEGQQEPVAWRYRTDEDAGEWDYTNTEPAAGAWGRSRAGWECQPLYTRPAKQAVSDEALDRLIDCINDQLIDADVDYPAGERAGHSISYDDVKMRSALTAALAQKEVER